MFEGLDSYLAANAEAVKSNRRIGWIIATATVVMVLITAIGIFRPVKPIVVPSTVVPAPVVNIAGPVINLPPTAPK